ncbi:MAG: DUF3307 domain-containing protein [Terrimonas sp.]|nr:DUF3307 domain-containing protein [Terrimonas sp.]
MDILLLLQLVIAHITGDFLLQHKYWIEDRRKKHYNSGYLYLHAGIVALLTLVLTGTDRWFIVLIIFVTHILIDLWKSYRLDTSIYFIIDQFLHFLVIAVCWWFSFYTFGTLKEAWVSFISDKDALLLFMCFILITWPASITIAQLTKKWRDRIDKSEDLSDAGKWIGMIERILIVVLVLRGQYTAIGFLVAAKGFIRFKEEEMSPVKAEYLLIGTLLSFSFAILTGLILMV